MAKTIQVVEKLNEYLPALIILIAGAAVLTYNLGHWSFWFDESFTSTLIKYDYGEIADRTARDVHPPLYYILLKFWSGLFGTTDAALRSLSAVLMVGAAGSLYSVLKRMANRYVGYLGLVAVFAGPFVIRYGQEARMYALAAMLLSIATLALHTQMNRSKKKRTLLLWVVYAAAIAAALYTHYFTFPIIFAHWLYVIYMDSKLSFDRKFTPAKLLKTLRGLDKNWWRANLLAGFLFLPWLPTFIDQATRVNGGFWIPDVRHTSVTDTLTNLFMWEGFSHEQGPARVIFGILFTVWLVAGLALLWRRIERSEKANAILLAGPVVLSTVILALYSLPPFTSSVFSVRYLASMSVLLYLSVAYVGWLVWKHVSPKLAVLVVSSVLLVMIGGTTQVIWGWGRDHFVANAGIERLNSVLREGDAVVAEGYWQQYDTYHYIDPDFTPQVRVEGNFYGGETLLIGREDIIIDDYQIDVKTSTGVIWYVSSADDTFDQLPSTWQPVEELFLDKNFKITRMVVK